MATQVPPASPPASPAAPTRATAEVTDWTMDGAADVDDGGAEGDGDISKAAAALGKKGGEAAAKARKVAEKEAQRADVDEDEERAAGAPEKAKDEPDEAAGADHRGNPRHDPKARIAVLAREKNEARERAERAEARLSEMERERERFSRREPEPQAPERREAEADPDPEPKAEDYEDHAEYTRDLARWHGSKGADERWNRLQGEAQARQRAHAHATALTNALTTFRERFAEAAKTDPDLAERTRDLQAGLKPTWELQQGERPHQTNLMADEIIRSERGPALMRHFADHPEEFQRIAALRTVRDVLHAMAIVEGRLEAVTADTSSETEEVSRARPPVRSVAGSPHTVDEAPGDDADFDAFARFHNAREYREKRASRR